MGFFKDIAFGASRKWEIARCYYGDDIARELYYLPNSEPLSLLTEAERTARISLLSAEANYYASKHLLKDSNKEHQRLRDTYDEAKKALRSDFITMKEAQMRAFGREYAVEKAECFWRHRLELFKKNGSVEEE